VGTNCQHPDAIVAVSSYLLARTTLPVTASANAGNPAIERGLVRYELTPEGLLTVAERLASLGVAVIGGCCGTTASHIRAIATAIQGRTVPKAAEREILPAAGTEQGPAQAAAANPIRELLQTDRFLISVEIRADRNSSLDSLCCQSAELTQAGADLFDVPDNPGASVGRDAAVTAARLQDVLKVPALFHKAVTQANLLQLHSGLLGAWDLGLKGLLAITGDPPSVGPLGALAQRVTDLKSSVELLRLIRCLRGGTLINGDRLADAPDYCAGATIGGSAPAQLAWLKKKIEAGAEFVFSQPLFTAEAFRQLRDEVAGLGVRFFPGLLPLLSQRNAAFFASGRIPGIRVPGEMVQAFARFETAADQKKFGLELAFRQAEVFAAEGEGIYLLMPFGPDAFADTADLIRHLRSLRPA
jgi:homocysteine S-methyltransferase